MGFTDNPMYKLVSQLYTNQKSDWILNIEESAYNAMPIQRWLCRNDQIRVQVRWLDKYTFNLPTKMFISLAWSVIPKSARVPYMTDIKKITDEEKEQYNILMEEDIKEFDFLLPKIRKHYELSDNDFRTVKPYILKSIKKQMFEWFRFYGVDKGKYKLFYMDYKKLKDGGPKPPIIGLEKWGL